MATLSIKEDELKIGDNREENKVINEEKEESSLIDGVLGYFIYYGVTSCRVFEILKDGESLKSMETYSYKKQIDDDDDNEEYLEELVYLTEEKIRPLFKDNSGLFIKTCADPNFARVFHNETDRDTFIFDFYKKTGLCFNILSYDQAEKNLSNTFKALEQDDVIINIGGTYVDIYIKKGEDFKSINLPFGVSQIEAYINEKNWSEIWNKVQIKEVKEYIKTLIGTNIQGKAGCAYILKDELKFMREMGYPLGEEKNGDVGILIKTYKEYNRKHLFEVDYREKLREKYSEEADRRREYGFKYGHLVLETLFEVLGVKTVFPSNYHCIHGNADAYIFKIVVGGSTKKSNMLKAIELLQKMGAIITSPVLRSGNLAPIDDETDEMHLIALKQCDLLFICNDRDDAYFGEKTGHQIYGAQLLNKPIAYWKEPSVELMKQHGVGFIPHECWESKMKALGNK